MNKTDRKKLRDAVEFAHFHHRGRTRKDNIMPEICHPMDALKILHRVKCKNINILCAAVLHDTIEDTAVSHETLLKAFGPKIADIVLEMTDEGETRLLRKKNQLRKAIYYSFEAACVRLADCISNLTDRYIYPLGDDYGYVLWKEEMIKEIPTSVKERDTYKALEKEFVSICGLIKASSDETTLEKYYSKIK